MTVKEEGIIHRLPSFVWPYLATTDMLPRWNPSIRRIFPRSPGPFRPHFEFDITLLTQNGEHEYSGEVVEFVEHRRIVFKLRSKSDPSIPVSTEAITLSPVVKGTKIERMTEIYDKEKTISWWVKLLMRIFGRFKKRTPNESKGNTLHRLAKLVEQNSGKPGLTLRSRVGR